MEHRVGYLPAVGTVLITGAASFYLGMSQCGGPRYPRDLAFAIAVLCTLVLGMFELYATRSKKQAALVLGSGILGYYVGGALGWVHYIAPVTISEAFGELLHGIAGGC